MWLVQSLSVTEWLVAIVCLGVLIYLYATWTFKHFEQQGIPFAKNPLPFFGNIVHLMTGKKPMFDVYVGLYKELKGNRFGGYFKFREPAIMLEDPELIKIVMSTQFSSFHDNDIDISIDTDPIFGRNPFVLRGERWKTVRSQLTPAFTPGKIKPLFPLIEEVCQELIKYLVKEGSVPDLQDNKLHNLWLHLLISCQTFRLSWEADQNKHDQHDGLEVKELASKFTTDVVATCAYGLHGNSFNDPKAEFREMGRNMMKSSWLSNFRRMIYFMMPRLAKLLKLSIFNETVSNFFRDIVKLTMDYREKNNITRQDFLQLLMQLKAKGKLADDAAVNNHSHERFTDEDVAAQALTFFTDGSETSATAMCFVLFEVAANEHIQKRLRSEVLASLKKHDGKLSFEMLLEMPYLEMVVAETLRKYPPASFLTRFCTKPYKLETSNGKVYQCEVGTTVALSILGLHMDPEYYPDPNKFDPERFTDENKASRHSYVYLPFGSGPRLCIGNRFATTQIKAGVAAIISNFNLQLCKKTSNPIVFNPHSLMPLAKDGIWVNFTKLEQN